MEELIGALEQATEGSRELDIEIFLATRTDKEVENLWALSGLNAQRKLWTQNDLFNAVRESPATYGALYVRYSQSLDAALTLVPEGCGYRLYESNNRKQSRVQISDDWLDEWKTAFSYANTPALALCLAALKARSTIQ